jgi:hypothetical protein
MHVSDVLGQLVLSNWFRVAMAKLAPDGMTLEPAVLDMTVLVFQCHDARVDRMLNCGDQKIVFVMATEVLMGIATAAGKRCVWPNDDALFALIIGGDVCSVMSVDSMRVWCW